VDVVIVIVPERTTRNTDDLESSPRPADDLPFDTVCLYTYGGAKPHRQLQILVESPNKRHVQLHGSATMLGNP